MKYNQKVLNAILRQDLSSFIAKVFYTINPGTEFQSNWHIDLIADYLNSVSRGEINRLIINIPPRALKSICISVAWPAWLLGQNPAKRIMAASYSSILSIKHSLDCRLVLQSEWYQDLFPSTKLSKKHNQKSKFLTSENGFRFATSVGGSATGEGGDILIIDDPHNPTQIHSLNARQKVVNWFEQTFVTRLNDKRRGAIVLVMQRLHEEDLTAYLTANSDYWHLLKIPARATEQKVYQIGKTKYVYEYDQLLHLERDKKEFLYNIEREIGTRNFAAQFMQEPLPANVSLLSYKDISFYDELIKYSYFVLSWDTAIKTSEKSDYTVGTCWGIIGDKYYLVDMMRKKLSYPDLKCVVEKQMKKYKPKYTLIEDKASGQSLIQDLVINGYQGIQAIKTMQDKITRFAAVTPLFQSGQVLLPTKSIFNQELIKELTIFPNSSHDDIVDSVSQFLNFMKEVRMQPKMRVRIL